ncbi:MAG TPA: response regulator transcription factor [Solirubrobacteraceae bacterium]|jgi:DNA-binding response OmpR family regulator|nr:response regulator transcription factor [Solirubrobacteraceae bacterium]
MTQAAQARAEVLEVGPLQIVPDEHLARAEGRALMLSIRELRLLTELARRADRIVTREELFRLVWGREMRVRDRSVDVYVRKLRVKLEAALPGWSFIHTHFGLGYRLAADPRQVVTAGSQLINTMRDHGADTLPDSN